MNKFLVLISLKDWVRNENTTVDLIEVEIPSTIETCARIAGYEEFERKMRYQTEFRAKVEKEFGSYFVVGECYGCLD